MKTSGSYTRAFTVMRQSQGELLYKNDGGARRKCSKHLAPKNYENLIPNSIFTPKQGQGWRHDSIVLDQIGGLLSKTSVYDESPLSCGK